MEWNPNKAATDARRAKRRLGKWAATAAAISATVTACGSGGSSASPDPDPGPNVSSSSAAAACNHQKAYDFHVDVTNIAVGNLLVANQDTEARVQSSVKAEITGLNTPKSVHFLMYAVVGYGTGANGTTFSEKYSEETAGIIGPEMVGVLNNSGDGFSFQQDPNNDNGSASNLGPAIGRFYFTACAGVLSNL